MNLTEHFKDVELGVAGVDPRIIDNAQYLCQVLLEPIRARFQHPVRIHDGYRDAEHNARVGGKPDSWHLYEGTRAACDFDVFGVTLKDTFEWLRLQSELPFDKVILESSQQVPKTIHIQIDRVAGPRRLAYTGSIGDGTIYTPVFVV